MEARKIGAILTITGGKARVWHRQKGVRQAEMRRLLEELAALPGVEAWPLPDEKDMFCPGRLRNHSEILMSRTDTDGTYVLVRTSSELLGP